jgi:hypothetical protein
VVANSIYNVDPESFSDEESHILKAASAFLTPSKYFIVLGILHSIYPFLSNYFKFSFAKPGAEKFFINLMNNAIDYREKRNIKAIDFLEHLMALKKKKEISGKVEAGMSKNRNAG